MKKLWRLLKQNVLLSGKLFFQDTQIKFGLGFSCRVHLVGLWPEAGENLYLIWFGNASRMLQINAGVGEWSGLLLPTLAFSLLPLKQQGFSDSTEGLRYQNAIMNWGGGVSFWREDNGSG